MLVKSTLRPVYRQERERERERPINFVKRANCVHVRILSYSISMTSVGGRGCSLKVHYVRTK